MRVLAGIAPDRVQNATSCGFLLFVPHDAAVWSCARTRSL